MAGSCLGAAQPVSGFIFDIRLYCYPATDGRAARPSLLRVLPDGGIRTAGAKKNELQCDLIPECSEVIIHDN